MDHLFAEQEKIVAVLVPIPAAEPYSYLVPPTFDVELGSFVRVPLGGREVAGIVCALDQVPPKKAKLRAISHVFDCPPLDSTMLRFIHFVADYTLAPIGMVARMILRVPTALDPPAPLEGLRLGDQQPSKMTDTRRRVLELAENGLAWTRSGLAHAAGVSAGVIDSLLKQHVLEKTLLPAEPITARPDADYHKTDLNPAQQEAADALVQKVQAAQFAPVLLEGVTGSGKTEVYFEAIAETIRRGKQVLILLPEIALTQQFLQRFERRFGAYPAQWHSELSPRQRERVWRQSLEGRIQIVAGARSALFLPFKDLGLIIVDEEHDSAYKQEDRVFYNARDMAVARASLEKIPVILASATPAVETQVNVQRGRYGHVQLPTRFAEAALPDLLAVDLRVSPPDRGCFLSPVLIEALVKTQQVKQQALLFLNRRGYAPLTLCRICGHRFQCPNCSAWLVEHRFRNQIVCHHCGYHQQTPEMCPECGTFDHLAACGPGVERIAEEVGALFPQSRIIVLSTDLPGGVGRLRAELDAITKGEVDIIIGTQLVAKGHHFPHLSLVGVVDADIGLANGDPRAAERTFQLLSQVTGRAGRSGIASQGLIQTYQPEHPVIRALLSGKKEEFYAREIMEREQNQLPPFGQLAALIISAPDRQMAEQHARQLRQAAPFDETISVLGPAEAPLAFVRGNYRYRLLIHGSRRANIQAYIRAVLKNCVAPPRSLRVQIDIDPQSFL